MIPIGQQWWVNRKVEAFQMWVVWNLPHWVVRWSVVRATAFATTGQYSHTDLPSITATDVLKRWG